MLLNSNHADDVPFFAVDSFDLNGLYVGYGSSPDRYNELVVVSSEYEEVFYRVAFSFEQGSRSNDVELVRVHVNTAPG